MPKTGRPRTIKLPMGEVRKLAARGWSLGELAEKYGCSRQTMLDRMREAGIQRLPQHAVHGERNGSWRGGRYVDADGYVMVRKPDHPGATKAGYVREHRLVMEKKLGRPLCPGEVVHHRDKDKANNRPSNLVLFVSNAQHLRSELAGQIPRWTEEGKRRISDGCRRGGMKAAARAKK
jgi:hypothetical protein